MDDPGNGGAFGGDFVGVVFPLEGFVGAAGELGGVDDGQVEVDDGGDVAGDVGGVVAVGHDLGAGEDPGEGFAGLVGFDAAHPGGSGFADGFAVADGFDEEVEGLAGGREPAFFGFEVAGGLAGLGAEHEEGGVDLGGAGGGAEDGFVFAAAVEDAEEFEGHFGIEGLAFDADFVFGEVDINVGEVGDAGGGGGGLGGLGEG